ncbi:anti-sigma factor [Microbacterium sp. USHLN186]|uniref:anti-sigma factor n=1 Tax=Microbacterium sp. USHLN186 TaxID=3081286 RepID=UPI003017B641
MNEREFAELSAGHALGALSDADERRFVDALAAHPEWRAIADDDLDVAAALGAALMPVDPPPALRADLLARIAQTRPEAAAPAPVDAEEQAPSGESEEPSPRGGGDEQSPRRRWPRLLFALAAGLALLVGGGIATTAIVTQLQRPASVVALDEIRSAPDAGQAQVRLDSGVTATAHWSGQLGKAVLVTSGLEELGPQKSYELWFVRGDEPIAAGVFDTDDGSATALLDEPMHAGDVIAVTIEQAGGSPSGKPTSDPVIVIPTA